MKAGESGSIPAGGPGGAVQPAGSCVLIPGAGGQSEKLGTCVGLKRVANKAWRAAVAAFL